MHQLALLSNEALHALAKAKGTPEFFTVRKTVWEAHKHLPKFPSWELFKRVVSSVL